MSESEWEELATSNGGAHEHSFAYGEVAEMVLGTPPLRLISRSSDGGVACIQGTGSTRTPGGTIRVGGMSGGPILKGHDQESPARVLMRDLEARLRRHLAGRLVIHEWRDTPLAGVLGDIGYRVERSVGVYEVDLSKGIQKVWEGMHPNKRRKIRQAERKGVKFRESKEGIEIAQGMFDEAGRRGKFKPLRRKWTEGYLKIYGRRDMATLYMVTLESDPVSCALVLRHGKTAFCPAAGSLKKGWFARPNDYMHWMIMRAEFERGITRYNMGGVNTDPGSPAYGVYRWKREYGGGVRMQDVFTKTLSPVMVRIRSGISGIKSLL